MWFSKGHGTKKGGEGNGLVAVPVDKDKGSQNALKWTVENLLSKGQNLLKIGLSCCEEDVERRLDIKEVVEKIDVLKGDDD
jgi:hypothetical protein